MQEKQVKELEQALDTEKNEFQNYRSRAHTLLQEKGTSAYQKRIQDLEEQISELEEERLAKGAERIELEHQVARLQKDLDYSSDKVVQLERNLVDFNQEAQVLSHLKAELARSKELLQRQEAAHEEHLGSLKQASDDALNVLKREHTLDMEKLQTALAESQIQLTNLETLNAELRAKTESLEQDLVKALNNLEHLKKMARTNSQLTDLSDGLPKSSQSLVINTHPALDSFKEKEYQLKIEQLNFILADSQAEIERYAQQVQVLKQEVLKVDRSEKRLHINMEYLKNIVISFFESESRSVLLT